MIGALTGAGAAAALGEITAGMTGMDLSTAWANQGMSDPYNVGFGVNNWTSNEPAITGNTENSIISSEESDPVEAYEEQAEENPDQISGITGGIVSGSTVGTINYALLETYNGDVKAVMPVAVPLDVAIVAGAQVLGVSMDAAELDVETKQALGNSIIAGQGLIYEGASNLVKAWWDGVNILFPRKTIKAIEDELVELGIGGGNASAEGDIYPGVSFPIMSSYYAELEVEGSSVSGVKDPNEVITGFYSTGSYDTVALIVASKTSPLTYKTITDSFFYGVHTLRENSMSQNGSSYTYNGKTVYYYTAALITSQYNNLDLTGFPLTTGNLMEYGAAWTAIWGNITPGGEFPEGTSPSEATSYTSDSIASAGGLALSDSETEDLVPVNIPENMTNTIGSTVDPISSTDDDTVSDLPAPPIPLPIPDTNVSNPDVPLTDASVINAALIDELVEELANTLDPQPAQSTGLIPFPLLPGLPDGQGGSSYPSIVPASGSGLIHVYNPTPAEFVSFGNWLWVTYADASIDKIWNNPFDGIIGAHELYATPSTDGTDNIRSGFLVCPTTAALVRQRYTEIDCGSIIIPEFYGNYLDYSPYSQAYVYLPFIGIQEVSIDDIVGHAINIRYRVDAYNGSCIAMIYVAKSGYRNLCYQFAGNCAVEVPLAGGSQAAIKAGMMQAEAYATAGVQSSVLTGIGQALSGLASGFAHGGIYGALGGLASGALGGLANYGAAKINAGATRDAALVANKSSVQHSGTFGASHGAMGLKIPFIMIRNPIQVKVVNYNEDYGFPAHKRVIIGGCHGYLRVKEVNVISATATNEEKMAIEEALKAGVYVD